MSQARSSSTGGTSSGAPADWRGDGLAGLAALAVDDLPALEILYLDALAAHVLASGELVPPYTVEHGAQVVAQLLRATTAAPSYRPDRAPEPTEAVTLLRAAFVEGAHAFARRGRAGLSQLVNRLIPAAVGELELQSDSPEDQVRSLFRYGLMAVASGPANRLSEASAEAVSEIFLGWDALIGAGFVPPWRIAVAR